MDLAEIGFWAVSGKNLHAPAAPGRGAEADRGGLGITLVWYFTHLEPRGARRWARLHLTRSRDSIKKAKGQSGGSCAAGITAICGWSTTIISVIVYAARPHHKNYTQHLYTRNHFPLLPHRVWRCWLFCVGCLLWWNPTAASELCVCRCAWPASGKILKFLCEQ